VTNIVPLNVETHRALSVQPAGDAQKAFVPVVVGEFTQLVVHYPILFSKDPETGTFYCGVMRGFDRAENLFAEEGDGIYRPLDIQRGPFFAQGQDLAIDLDSPRVGNGQPLFTESGEPSPYLQGILKLFRDLIPGFDLTKQFIKALLDHALIEPIDITVAFDGGERRKLEGLYTINRDKLRALPDAVVVEFFRRGYLDLIVMMLASLNHISVLARKRNARSGKPLDIGPRV
jgi:hypothetical protein